MELKHPALIAAIGGPVAAAVLGGFVWIKDTILQPSDLRATIEHPTQAVPLMSYVQSELKDSRIYCDTVKFSLLISHNHHGQAPILVNRIAIRTSPISLNALNTASRCRIDSLGSRPYGIEPRSRVTPT